MHDAALGLALSEPVAVTAKVLRQVTGPRLKLAGLVRMTATKHVVDLFSL